MWTDGWHSLPQCFQRTNVICNQVTHASSVYDKNIQWQPRIRKGFSEHLWKSNTLKLLDTINLILYNLKWWPKQYIVVITLKCYKNMMRYWMTNEKQNKTSLGQSMVCENWIKNLPLTFFRKIVGTKKCQEE